MEANRESLSNQVPENSQDAEDSVDVQFDVDGSETEVQQSTETAVDLSKYTVIDHLDEDDVIESQKFCLFSFLSPEGIMNCNVRALKFRGAYATMKEAEERARELEKKDKYFKIFIGETGKWLDFDPPSSKVEREMSSNKEHQKILDAQRKLRMDKINDLAGKHKEIVEKKESGKKERIEESKKAGAASDAVEKERAKRQEKREEKEAVATQNSRASAAEKTRARLQKRLAENQRKRELESLAAEDRKVAEKTDLETKIKVVGKASSDLEDKKAKLAEADKNIENIKNLLSQMKAAKQ